MSDKQGYTPTRLESFFLRFGVLGEMLVHFASGRNWWLTPLVLLLGLFGLVLVFLQSIEYVAPFVYLAF